MGRQHMIRFRRDTAANWAAANPILVAGEPGFETDTGVFKIGDGVTAWATLLGSSVGGGGGGATGKLITSRFYESPVYAIGSTLLAEAQGHFGSFWQPAGYRVDDLTLETMVVGTAGAVMRLGVFAQAANGTPGAVLVDAGTLDGTILGVQTLAAVVAAPSAGRLMFLAFAIQGAAATRPTVRTGTAIPSGPGGSTLTADLNATRGVIVTNTGVIPGAFVANPVISASATNIGPRIMVRGTQL